MSRISQTIRGSLYIPNGMSSLILGAVLIPIGIIAALLTQPLATGAEELVRWQTIVFGNKTAMFFMVLGMIGLLGGIYYGRAKTLRGKALVAIATGTIYLLVGWRIALLSPFDIALNYGG